MPPSRVASERSPRCAATRTAPGRLPTIHATCATSRPAISRSTITSACSRGRVAISVTEASVDRLSSAAAAVSCTASRSSSPHRPLAAPGAAHHACAYRSPAGVSSHARNRCSPPLKRARPRATSSHTSPATSSSPASTCRYRSNGGHHATAGRTPPHPSCRLPAARLGTPAPARRGHHVHLVYTVSESLVTENDADGISSRTDLCGVGSRHRAGGRSAGC